MGCSMKKYLKYLPYVYFVILGIVIFTCKDLRVLGTDLEYVKCGNATGIPKPLPQMTTVLYTIIMVATPIILIGFSVITMIKAIGTRDEEEITKAKKKVVKKFIQAGIIILLAAISQFTINRVTSNEEDSATVKKCLRCFLFYSEGPTACEESDPGNDVVGDTHRQEPRSSMGEDTTSNREARESNMNQYASNENPGNGNLGSKTIIMGDSRTVGLCGFSDSYSTTSAACRDWHGVARGGIGYAWMNSTGIPGVNSVLQSNAGTRYNILNWLGINDLGASTTYPQQPEIMAQKYGDKMIEMANGDWKNQNVIMVSVTDIGVENTGGQWPVDRTNIRSFNAKLKERINNAHLSNLHYCDISSLDMSGGFWPDNLHHNSDGNNRLYNEMKTKCLS